MQNPPPDRESIISDLWKVYEKHFHGHPHTKGPEQRAIRNAVDALNTPQSAQDLVNALQNQSHTIDAAGWSGAAVLMRDAARRLSWHLQHGVDMPGATIPLPKEELVKDLVRYAKSQSFDVPAYTSSVLLQAAKIISETIDKPKDEALPDITNKSVTELLHFAGVHIEQAQSHAVLPNNLEERKATRNLSHTAVQYLNAAIKKL